MNKTLILISTLTIAIFSLLIVAMSILPTLDSRTSASVDQNLQELQNLYNSKVSEAKASASAASQASAQAQVINADYKNVCWNNVVKQTDGYYWKDGCKGEVPDKSKVCTTSQVAMTTAEMFGYLSWQADELPLNSACNQVLGAQDSSVSSSVTSTVASKVATNAESCAKYDLNGDKTVNANDLSIVDFNKYLNKKVTANKYDFDGNKLVNNVDLNLFIQAVADFALGNNCK